MESLEVNTYLFKENLFDLFKQQLKKDFESCGVNTDFTAALVQDFDALKSALADQLQHLSGQNSQIISTLLYRVDVSESQLRNYQTGHPSLSFYETLAELFIKRILQKVIFKKTFLA